MTSIKDIITLIENHATPALQESYDNAGLILGERTKACTGVIICLDSIEAVVDEAIRKSCNLIVAHHPIVFSGLKKFSGNTYVERVLLKAIKNDIAIYAAHTNLDNVLHMGVNSKIAEKLGLSTTKILSPKLGLLLKLVTFVPSSQAKQVLDALFAAGAGHIGNYSECSFSLKGEGTFKAGSDADPFVGEIGKRHTEAEERIEVVLPNYLKQAVVAALKSAHPYEEVAYDLYSLANELTTTGSGLIGELESPMDEKSFFEHIKKTMDVKVIRHTALRGKLVKTVALCGGAGSFLLKDAIRQEADVFVSADFKYHEFFDADGKLVVADIGHYETEHFTGELFRDIILKKFPTFAVHLTEVNTNPVNYF